MNGCLGKSVYRQSKISFKYFFSVSIINSMYAVLRSVIVSKQLKMRKSFPINYRQDTISRVYNHFYNSLRLFNVLPNFLFTASETMGDCYL